MSLQVLTGPLLLTDWHACFPRTAHISKQNMATVRFPTIIYLSRIFLLSLFRCPNAVHVFNKYIGIDFIPIYLLNNFIFLSFEITVSHKQPLHEWRNMTSWISPPLSVFSLELGCALPMFQTKYDFMTVLKMVTFNTYKKVAQWY